MAIVPCFRSDFNSVSFANYTSHHYRRKSEILNGNVPSIKCFWTTSAKWWPSGDLLKHLEPGVQIVFDNGAWRPKKNQANLIYWVMCTVVRKWWRNWKLFPHSMVLGRYLINFCPNQAEMRMNPLKRAGIALVRTETVRSYSIELLLMDHFMSSSWFDRMTENMLKSIVWCGVITHT